VDIGVHVGQRGSNEDATHGESIESVFEHLSVGRKAESTASGASKVRVIVSRGRKLWESTVEQGAKSAEQGARSRE
jgi:hypothetical protein